MQPIDPTPAEIKTACEAIRAKWSEAETRKRAAWMLSAPVSVIECEVDDDEATGAN